MIELMSREEMDGVRMVLSISKTKPHALHLDTWSRPGCFSGKRKLIASLQVKASGLITVIENAMNEPE